MRLLVKFLFLFLAASISPPLISQIKKVSFVLSDSVYLRVPGTYMYQAYISVVDAGYIVTTYQTGKAYFFDLNFNFRFEFEKTEYANEKLKAKDFILIPFFRRQLYQTKYFDPEFAFETGSEYWFESHNNLFAFSKAGKFIRRVELKLKMRGDRYYLANRSVFYLRDENKIGMIIRTYNEKKIRSESSLVFINYPFNRNERPIESVEQFDSVYKMPDLVGLISWMETMYDEDAKALYLSNALHPQVTVFKFPAVKPEYFGRPGEFASDFSYTLPERRFFKRETSIEFTRTKNVYGSGYACADDFYRLYWQGRDWTRPLH
jgi:hypothetical protein